MISAQLDLLIASRYAAGIREPVVVLHPRDVGEVMEWVAYLQPEEAERALRFEWVCCEWVGRGGLAVLGRSSLEFEPRRAT